MTQYMYQLFSLRNFILCLRGVSQQALLPFGLVQRTYVMQEGKMQIVFQCDVMIKMAAQPNSVHSP